MSFVKFLRSHKRLGNLTESIEAWTDMIKLTHLLMILWFIDS